MVLILLAWLIGCDSGDKGDSVDTDSATDTDTDTDTDPDTTDTNDTDTDATETDTDTVVTIEPGEPGVTGILVGPDGVALAGHDVLICYPGQCIFAVSGQDGGFGVALDPGTPVAVKTHEDINADPLWGAALEPAIVGDGTLDLGNVHIPDMPEPVKLGPESADPQTLAIGDGLTMTFNRADLDAEIGVFLYDVAARRLPAEHIPPYPQLNGEAVEAVYAIHPFATESDSPVAFELPSTLPAGTLVHLRSIGILDGTFSEPAIGHADGAKITTDPGEGLDFLSYVVVSVP